MPAVIIDMVEKRKIFISDGRNFRITKESLRTLIKKQQDPILNDLLREHFDRKKHKKTNGGSRKKNEFKRK